MSPGGFKLHHFEVFNWGTFDQKVWALDLQGLNALLTGENGTGKSTLVDGLLTLLVANQKRNYNLASGSEKKERTESSYVKGAFGREQSELGREQTKYLRQGDIYSLLLARFQDSWTQDLVTLGQFFWLEQSDLKKIFFISHSSISIQNHLDQITSLKDLKNRLKNIPQTFIFSTFLEYQSYFIKYVGLRSEKGLDLFNQITAIKEIQRLNEFVRKHMLNASEVPVLLESLYKNYENLSLSYESIVLAKNQLEELTPLALDAKKLETIESRVDQIRQRRHMLTPLLAVHKKKAFYEQKMDMDQKVTSTKSALSQLDTKNKILSEQKLEMMRLLSQESEGQELERLDLILSQMEEKRRARQKQAQAYHKLVQLAKMENSVSSESLSVKEFSLVSSAIKTCEPDLRLKLSELRQQLYEEKKSFDLLTEEIRVALLEGQSLKQRKNRLPSVYVALREKLIQSLGLSAQTLPFVAELVKVKDSESQWEGVIEKVLHSLALRLLVPHDLYKDVSRFLNKTNLGVRLVFQNVDRQSGGRDLNEKRSSAPEGGKLFSKLEFRPKSSWTAWVQEQIVKNYDYMCVDQLEIFQKQHKALTPQGLIKHNGSLHEKDDRFSINDKSRYILGWDNQEALDLVFQTVQEKEKASRRITKSVQELEKEISRTEVALNALRELSKIEDFESLDWMSLSKEIEKIKKQKELLEKISGKSEKIRKALDQTAVELQACQEARDVQLGEQAILLSQMKVLTWDIEACEKVLTLRTPHLSEEEVERETREWILPLLKKDKQDIRQLKPQDFVFYENKLRESLDQSLSKFDSEREQLQHSVVRKMAQFKSHFYEQAVDLEPSLQGLKEFLALKEKIEKDALPEHERRFKNLLSKSIMSDMAAFKSTLDLSYEEIQETVAQLNISLREIPYSESTYVQIHTSRSQDIEVREFQQMLRHVLALLQNSSSEGAESWGESFKKMKSLLDRLKKEERWTKKVTDVRQWADFYVQEYDLSHHQPRNYYSDSAGLSGGQKAKLAFTILASAVAYQYGLDPKKKETRSFRFIVVDEAFSKSDEKNSRYAMELFQNLGLQVMVVTPKDKIHVVENYINSVFLTQIKGSQDCSQIVTMKIKKPNQKFDGVEGALVQNEGF